MHTRRARTLSRLCTLIIFCALPLIAHAQTRDRLDADLFLDWEFVQSPQISPDGKQVIYTRRWADKVNDAYVNDLWIVNADGTLHRFLAVRRLPERLDVLHVRQHGAEAGPHQRLVVDHGHLDHEASERGMEACTR